MKSGFRLLVFRVFLKAAVLHHLMSFTTIFMLTALLMLHTACLSSFRGLAVQDILLFLTLIMSSSLMQELTSTLNH